MTPVTALGSQGHSGGGKEMTLGEQGLLGGILSKSCPLNLTSPQHGEGGLLSPLFCKYDSGMERTWGRGGGGLLWSPS